MTRPSAPESLPLPPDVPDPFAAPLVPSGRIGPEDLWQAGPSLVHDLRCPLTALVAFTHLVEEGQPDLVRDGQARESLAGLAANAEQLGGLLEALAFVATPQAPALAAASDVLRTLPARWQKILSRAQVPLNLAGVFPDTPVERRSLAVLADALVRAIVRGLGRVRRPRVGLSASAADGVLTLMFTLSPAGSPGSAGPTAAIVREILSSACAHGEFTGLVLAKALDVLGGVVLVEDDVQQDSVRVSVRLSNPAASRGPADADARGEDRCLRS